MNALVGANAMNEYVETLRKKAREIAKKRAVIEERLKADNQELTKLLAADTGITALLRLEGLDAPSGPTEGGMPPGGTQVSTKSGSRPLLGTLLKETLVPGRIFDIEELIETAKRRGVDFGDKDPFKSVNFTLMGIRAGKTIERVDGRHWRGLPRQ
jgi:hypothetical protein